MCSLAGKSPATDRGFVKPVIMGCDRGKRRPCTLILNPGLCAMPATGPASAPGSPPGRILAKLASP
jgi:hypothetical protein